MGHFDPLGLGAFRMNVDRRPHLGFSCVLMTHADARVAPIAALSVSNLEWRTLALSAIQDEIPGFESWVLCGGYSVALWTGVDTRPHGDVDIGVFRSELAECLGRIGGDRVFLCRHGTHLPWDGGVVPQEVHDIWIADRTGKHWVLQIMVFDDEGERVFYRRDRRISWAKEHHCIEVAGMRVLNPFVTFLFKTNKTTMEEKEVHDVMQLIGKRGELFALSTRCEMSRQPSAVGPS